MITLTLDNINNTPISINRDQVVTVQPANTKDDMQDPRCFIRLVGCNHHVKESMSVVLACLEGKG